MQKILAAMSGGVDSAVAAARLLEQGYAVAGATMVLHDAAAREAEDAPDFDTIGGLVAHEMGHVPRRGEQFTFAGLRFVVLHTRGGAVRWFKVSPVAAAE